MPVGFFDGPMSGLLPGLPGMVFAMVICLSCQLGFCGTHLAPLATRAVAPKRRSGLL